VRVVPPFPGMLTFVLPFDLPAQVIPYLLTCLANGLGLVVCIEWWYSIRSWCSREARQGIPYHADSENRHAQGR